VKEFRAEAVLEALIWPPVVQLAVLFAGIRNTRFSKSISSHVKLAASPLRSLVKSSNVK
jgi:hypothetical protein